MKFTIMKIKLLIIVIVIYSQENVDFTRTIVTVNNLLILFLVIKPNPSLIMSESFNLPDISITTQFPGQQRYSGQHTLEFWIYIANVSSSFSGINGTVNPDNTNTNYVFRITTNTALSNQPDLRVFFIFSGGILSSQCNFSPGNLTFNPTVNTMNQNSWNFIACAYDASPVNQTAGTTWLGNNLAMVVNSNTYTTLLNNSFSSVSYNYAQTFILKTNSTPVFYFKSISLYNYFKSPGNILNYNRNTPFNSVMFMKPGRVVDSGPNYSTTGYGLQMHFPLKMTSGYGIYDYSWSAPFGTNAPSGGVSTWWVNKNVVNFGYYTEVWREDSYVFRRLSAFGTDYIFTARRRQVPNVDFNNQQFVLCYGDMKYNPSTNSCINTMYKEYLQNVVSASTSIPPVSISSFKLTDKNSKNPVKVLEEGSFTITFWAKFNQAAVTSKNGVDIFFGDYVSAGMSMETVGSINTIRHHLFLWPTSYSSPSDSKVRYQKAYVDVPSSNRNDVWIYFIATTNHYQNSIYLTDKFTRFSLYGHFSNFDFTGSFSIKARINTSGQYIFVKEVKFWSRYSNFMNKLKRYDTFHGDQLLLYIPFDDEKVFDYSPNNYSITVDSNIYKWKKTLTPVSSGYTQSTSTPMIVFKRCGINEVWINTCTCNKNIKFLIF
jgi:hypothetical protein